MYITYKLYLSQGFKYDAEACLNEIVKLNAELFYIVDDNIQLCNKLMLQVDSILLNKSFKTNFKLNIDNLDVYIYTYIILKSMYYKNFNYISGLNDFDFYNDMLHRNVVISNIQNIVEVFKVLNLNKDFKKNIIKILMTLDDFILQIKITTKKKNKLETDIYLKLNNLALNKDLSFTVLHYSNIAFKSSSYFCVGASYLTFCSFIKKSNYQTLDNEINTTTLIKLSKQQLSIDCDN
jgi:hypothetical protein